MAELILKIATKTEGSNPLERARHRPSIFSATPPPDSAASSRRRCDLERLSCESLS
jgi:hypothetical protein